MGNGSRRAHPALEAGRGIAAKSCPQLLSARCSCHAVAQSKAGRPLALRLTMMITPPSDAWLKWPQEAFQGSGAQVQSPGRCAPDHFAPASGESSAAPATSFSGPDPAARAAGSTECCFPGRRTRQWWLLFRRWALTHGLPSCPFPRALQLELRMPPRRAGRLAASASKSLVQSLGTDVNAAALTVRSPGFHAMREHVVVVH